jgi:hypothetical protein
MILLLFKIKTLQISSALFFEILITLRGNLAYFFAAIALLFMNYFFEILKWNILSRQIEARSFRSSTIEVLRGLRMGLLTPFMMGDFLGRSIDFKRENRAEAMALNMFNSACQTYTAIVFGCLALLLWGNLATDGLKKLLILPGIFLIVSTFLGLFFVLKIKFSWHFLTRVKFLKPYVEVSRMDLKLSNVLRIKVLMISFGRTLVYNLQFWFFYMSLGVDLPKAIVFIGVNLMLLVKTVGGGLNVYGDLTLREFISVHFFGIYHANGGLILIATFVVWFVNIFLPVIIGLFVKPKI